MWLEECELCKRTWGNKQFLETWTSAWLHKLRTERSASESNVWTSGSWDSRSQAAAVSEARTNQPEASVAFLEVRFPGEHLCLWPSARDTALLSLSAAFRHQALIKALRPTRLTKQEICYTWKPLWCLLPISLSFWFFIKTKCTTQSYIVSSGAWLNGVTQYCHIHTLKLKSQVCLWSIWDIKGAVFIVIMFSFITHWLLQIYMPFLTYHEKYLYVPNVHYHSNGWGN